jgi:hypothetical protein
MFEVRFHLGRGEHYMHWQVKTGAGKKFYYNPAYYQLELIGCKLVNKVNKAKKVNAAGVKDVSGWVECEDILVNNEVDVDNLEKLYYNPIKNIHWLRESDCGEFAWDDYKFDILITKDRQVYVLEERSSG